MSNHMELVMNVIRKQNVTVLLNMDANVLFVVYHNNRVVEKYFEQVSVFLSETVTFDLTTPAQKLQQAQKLNPGKYQLKMFVLDDEYKVMPFTY